MGEDVENPAGGRVEEDVENPIEKEVEYEAENVLVEEVASEAENILEEEVESKAENVVEEPLEKAAEKPVIKGKKIVAGIIIFLCTLLVFYFGMVGYFVNHFYFGSEINDIDVSVKSVEAVEELMTAKLQEYRLDLKERGGKGEQIKATEIGLRYQSDEEFKKLKESQNPFAWVLAWFDREDIKMTAEVTYDENLLKQRLDKLTCFESSYIIEPKNPSFQYVENSYVIIDEILGNKVDKELLYSRAADLLLKREVEIDFEAINCYVEPQYDRKSHKIIETNDTLNKYVASKITYTFGSSEEVLDGATINNWLTVDENFEAQVDEKKVEDYIDVLSEKYDTAGSIRNFKTSSGKTIQISGGDFSRPINREIEAQNLISAIKEGLTLTKEPVYGQIDGSYGNSDIGNTYVEIDLTKQHIWFYKNSSLIVEGDVVTGNVSSGHTTPKGVYSLKYKAKNVVLRGPGYAAPVTFWMPFNGGIGMHDANWRSVFGGNIYKTDGSHGCINCPRNVVKAIYNNIEQDTPVVCY